MNDYESRVEVRRLRLLTAASSAEKQSNQLFDNARTMRSVIPFGQPILVGHHSEGRDRRYRSRIDDKMRKGVDLMSQAERLRNKAASVGRGGISSDDPEAVVKLRKELEKLEKKQDLMKKANAFIRKNDREGLATLGLNAAQIDDLFQKDFCGRLGFPDCTLKNNNANIRRIKGRIDDLLKNREREAVEIKNETFTYVENVEENRCMFFFNDKPDYATRELLKAHAFKWSPNREGKPWVRQLTNSARYAAKSIISTLDSK